MEKLLTFGADSGIGEFGDCVGDVFVVECIASKPTKWRPRFWAGEVIETDERLLSCHSRTCEAMMKIGRKRKECCG